jgi:hypothetical protein
MCGRFTMTRRDKTELAALLGVPESELGDHTAPRCDHRVFGVDRGESFATRDVRGAGGKRWNSSGRITLVNSVKNGPGTFGEFVVIGQ